MKTLSIIIASLVLSFLVLCASASSCPEAIDGFQAAVANLQPNITAFINWTNNNQMPYTIGLTGFRTTPEMAEEIAEEREQAYENDIKHGDYLGAYNAYEELLNYTTLFEESCGWTYEQDCQSLNTLLSYVTGKFLDASMPVAVSWLQAAITVGQQAQYYCVSGGSLNTANDLEVTIEGRLLQDSLNCGNADSLEDFENPEDLEHDKTCQQLIDTTIRYIQCALAQSNSVESLYDLFAFYPEQQLTSVGCLVDSNSNADIDESNCRNQFGIVSYLASQMSAKDLSEAESIFDVVLMMLPESMNACYPSPGWKFYL